jgi:hypothetical protein
MPYDNYHVVIVRPESAFEKDSIRRKLLPKSKGGKGGVIINLGRPRGKDTMEAHSYWFPRQLYTIAEVKAWLKEYGVEDYQKIEPASGKDSLPSIDDLSLNALDFETRNVCINAKLNDVEAVDEGDRVRFPKVPIAAEGIFTTPDGKSKGFRSADEVRKMVPFCNGLRVVVNHPDPTTVGVTAANLADENFPVIGYTENAFGDEKAGLARANADIVVLKQDRAGNDQTRLIEQMKNGQLKCLSIGYFYAHQDQVGEALGENYDHLELDVNPYHLALLDGFEPQCAPPICGIGCNTKDKVGCNCAGCSHSHPTQEEVTDLGNDDKKTPESNAPSVKEMNLATIAGLNAEVKALVDAKAAAEKKVTDLETAALALNKKVKDGDEAIAKIEKMKAEERQAKLARLKESYGEETFKAIFPEDQLAGVSDAEIDRSLALVDTLGSEDAAPADAPAPPMAHSSKELKVPAGKTAPAPGANAEDDIPATQKLYKPLSFKPITADSPHQ